MKRNNKKGFTIVELVIVIAVIAILAAVLIPTFSSVVRKSRLSADQQAVRQMNTQLAIADADEDVETIGDAIKALAEADIDLKDYKALSKDHYFYFVVVDGTPKVILADASNNVVYPEDLKGISTSGWMSLSGQVPMSDDYTITNGSVTIDNGAEFVHLMEAVKADDKDVTTIKLNGSVDLKGAAVDFGTTRGDITIEGDDGVEITGIRTDDNAYSPMSGEYANHSYGFGLVGKVETGHTVTIKNVTLSGLVAGNTAGTHEDGANTTGLIAGYVNGTLKLENVVIEDSAVYGYQKIGGVVGQLYGKLEMKNVDFKNVKVEGSVEVAKIAGIIDTNGKISVDADCDLTGITVACVEQGQVKKSEIIFPAGSTFELKGDANNTFKAYDGYLSRGYDFDIVFFGGVTNDWAWKSCGVAFADRPVVTIDGVSAKPNGYVWSISENIA